MPATNRVSWKHEGMLLFVVLIWGINFPIVKSALGLMHYHVFNSFRFVVAVIVLGVTYYYRRAKLGQPFWEPLRLYGKQIALLGLLGYVVYQWCFIIGINITTAGNAALIMASSPLFAWSSPM